MISGSPLSSTPLSAALALSSGGNQTLTPTGPAIFTWVAPDATLVLSGNQSLVPTGPAIFTWVAPDTSLVNGGSIDAPSAVSTWVAGDATLEATGTATLVPTGPAVFEWVVRNRRLRRSSDPTPSLLRWVGLPFNRFSAVVVSDTVDLTEPSVALYVGAGGDVVAVEQDGMLRTFVDVPTGSILTIKAKRVNSTNTSAASIVALYRD